MMISTKAAWHFHVSQGREKPHSNGMMSVDNKLFMWRSVSLEDDETATAMGHIVSVCISEGSR
jgi:hypothetical protein